MKAFIIKNLESNMYLYDEIKETNRIWEASKFSTHKEASESIEFRIGYYEIIKIHYRNKAIDSYNEIS